MKQAPINLSSASIIAAVLLAFFAPATAFAQSRDGEGAADIEPPKKTEPTPAPASQTQTPTQATPPSSPDGLQPNPVTPPTPDQPPPASIPKPFAFVVFGYLRAGYDHTMKDSRYEFVGRNNGFILDSARVGIEGRSFDYNINFRVSIEGASDVLSAPNTPIGSLAVRLRDGFARWDPIPWVGVQAGQFKAPFQEEELRGTPDLMFASRAVGVEGVPPARGFQTPGIQLDRQLGIMLSPVKPIGSDGSLNVAYYFMVMNGNGSNQLLDDNGKLGLVARSELAYQKYVRLGAALFRNDRTVGTPPNLYNEEDLGLTGDLNVKVAGLEAFGAVTRVHTVFPTVGTSARVQLAWHLQLAYRVEIPNAGLFFAPAYRYAYFHPWQSGGDEAFNSFKLQYHTLGVRLGMLKLPIQSWINYTFTTEPEARALNNDRLEILGQVTF